MSPQHGSKAFVGDSFESCLASMVWICSCLSDCNGTWGSWITALLTWFLSGCAVAGRVVVLGGPQPSGNIDTTPLVIDAHLFQSSSREGLAMWRCCSGVTI